MSKDRVYDIVEKVLVSAIIAIIGGLMIYVIWAFLSGANEKQIIQYIFGIITKLPIGIYLIKKIRDL